MLEPTAPKWNKKYSSWIPGPSKINQKQLKENFPKNGRRTFLGLVFTAGCEDLTPQTPMLEPTAPKWNEKYSSWIPGPSKINQKQLKENFPKNGRRTFLGLVFIAGCEDLTPQTPMLEPTAPKWNEKYSSWIPGPSKINRKRLKENFSKNGRRTFSGSRFHSWM